MSTSQGPWFSEGLRFSCTSCGDCCQGSGHIWVNEAEIARLAAFLDMTMDAFGRRYLRRIGRRLALVDRDQEYCVFWRDGCTVYEARPDQCRTFPFWSENLANPRAWENIVETCPGTGTGRLYSHEQIVQLRRGQGSTTAEAKPTR